MAKRRGKKLIDPSSLPGTFRSRVFIGGSYKAAAGAGLTPRQMLDAVRAVVVRERLVPIVADEFVVENLDTDVHRDALYLLHACRMAIFELSAFSGALMEIERCADYGTLCLVLHKDPKGTGWRLSRMLSSFVREQHDRIRLYGYIAPDDARNAARNWLVEMKGLGHAKP